MGAPEDDTPVDAILDDIVESEIVEDDGGEIEVLDAYSFPEKNPQFYDELPSDLNDPWEQMTIEKYREMGQNLGVRHQKIQFKGGKEKLRMWKKSYVDRPKNDQRGWVLRAPGPTYWDRGDKYAPDDEGIILEHPSRVGTPTPQMITGTTIMAILAIPLSYVIVSIGIAIPWTGEDVDGMKIAMMFGPLFLAICWLGQSLKEGRRMNDTQQLPTSKVRSIAIGEVELVGQVRRWKSPAPSVQIDTIDRHAKDLHCWRWLYDVYVEKTVMTDDGPRTTYFWKDVRNKKGGHPFILHDGTGGVLVQPKSFEYVELGEHIVRWTVPANKTAIGSIGRIFKIATVGETILKHRWTLWGLALGDPCYTIGVASSRTAKQMKGETFQSKPNHSLIEITGKGAEKYEPRLERGTELAILSKALSQFEYNTIPALTCGGVFVMTLVAFNLVS